MSTAVLSDRLPPSAAWLGYGGLLPFLLLAPAVLLDHHHGPVFSDLLYAYAAIILSFVGALHWGFAIGLPDLEPARRRSLFLWSVVPALIAWPAAFLDPQLASLLLIVGFVLHYRQDRRLVRVASLPRWYLPLRLHLTVVASLCLLVAALPVASDGSLIGVSTGYAI
jgi:hypothetical protein